MAPFSFNSPFRLPDDAWTDAVAPSFVQRSPEEYAQMRGVVSGYPQSTPSAPPSVPTSAPSTDYRSMMDQLISPYRDIAARMDSPYAMFSPGNRFATAHPRMAGGIDNAFLALANMGPSGMTVGDNLSGVARGLVGANQWHHQNALQSMMMPYEMAAPHLKMMDEVAQMQQRGAMTQAELSRIPYEQAMEKRANAQSDWYMRRLNEPNEANIQLQLALRKNGVEDISKATPDQITAIQKDIDSMRFRQTMGGGGGGLLGALIYGAHPPADPSKGYTPDEYKSLLGIYGQAQANIAGGRTGAEQSAPHPFANTQDFISSQRQGMYKDIQAPAKNIDDFMAEAAMSGKLPDDIGAAYQASRSAYGQKVQTRNQRFAQWEKSGAPQKGIDFTTWDQQTPVAPAGSARSAPNTTAKPKGVWNPQKGVYE